MHCLKFQGIAPDGLLIHCFGPLEGRYHDRTAWVRSGIEENLEEHAFDIQHRPLQMYGEPAYGLSEHLLSPYRGRCTISQQEWNTSMSKVRIVVEWVFKEVTTLFPRLDWVPSQKILISPVGLEYPVAVLLHNAHVILHEPYSVLCPDIGKGGAFVGSLSGVGRLTSTWSSTFSTRLFSVTGCSSCHGGIHGGSLGWIE